MNEDKKKPVILSLKAISVTLASWIVGPFMNLESRQCSKPVENRHPHPPFFKIYSFRGLDGFERLSAEATFRTPPNTAKLLASARRVSGV